MSATKSTTDQVVAAANTLNALVSAAEQNPQAKADIQSAFNTWSHSAPIATGVAVAGVLLAQRGITVDNTLLTLVIGAGFTGVGYAAQYVAGWFSKTPKPAA